MKLIYFFIIVFCSILTLGCNKYKAAPFEWILNFFSGEKNIGSDEIADRENAIDDSIKKHSLLTTSEKHEKTIVKEEKTLTIKKEDAAENKNSEGKKTVEEKYEVEIKKIAEKKHIIEKKETVQKKETAGVVKKTDNILTKKELSATKKMTKNETEKKPLGFLDKPRVDVPEVK